MKIVTTTDVFPKQHGEKEIMRRLARLGYDGIDLGFYYNPKDLHLFYQDGWEKYVNELGEEAEQKGISYMQSHLWGDVTVSFEAHARSLKIASMLGIKYAVVHPVWRCPDQHIIMSEDEYFSVNLPLFRPLVEEAEKNGVILLNENLLWGPDIYPEVISRFQDEINSKYFGWCFDTGHANIYDLSLKDVKGVKNKPLTLHIQDNHGGAPGDKERQTATGGVDEHLMPGDGTVNWKSFLETLKEIDYKGEFVLEAHHQSLVAPDEERDAILTELLSRSRKMVDYYNKL